MTGQSHLHTRIHKHTHTHPDILYGSCQPLKHILSLMAIIIIIIKWKPPPTVEPDIFFLVVVVGYNIPDIQRSYLVLIFFSSYHYVVYIIWWNWFTLKSWHIVIIVFIFFFFNWNKFLFNIHVRAKSLDTMWAKAISWFFFYTNKKKSNQNQKRKIDNIVSNIGQGVIRQLLPLNIFLVVDFSSYK
mgnify:CR=1 FL=1